MPAAIREFESEITRQMESLTPTEGAAQLLAKPFADAGRWLAAWSALSPERSLPDSATLENGRLRFVIALRQGRLFAALLDKSSGQAFAEGACPLRLEVREAGAATSRSRLENASLRTVGAHEIEIRGKVGDFAVAIRYSLCPSAPGLEERIELRNGSSASRCVADFRLSLTTPSLDRSGVIHPWAQGRRWTAIPFRRDTLGSSGKYIDYSDADLRDRRGSYRVASSEEAYMPSDVFGSEGWVCAQGGAALLIAKHSQEHIEYSCLGVEAGFEGGAIRFGGFGAFHGDPEGLEAGMAPGEAVRFGVTRYEIVDGGWKEGYYAFRRFMNENGHALPPGFDPPIHWNELYDNPLWWSRQVENSVKRREMFRVEDMEAEAAKAKEMGCESLYIDPGWDDPFASSVWDEKRLGAPADFIRNLRTNFGLKVSLWVPLAAWPGETTYSQGACRLEADGKRVEGRPCGCAPEFLDKKLAECLKLCEAGAAFLVWDGTRFTGPCFDADHGHPVPYTREAHCRAIYNLTRAIHEKYPGVIIESHDMFGGGTMLRYLPCYYLHGLPGAHDEIWGFEYMWRPMEDLLRGWAISLYYFNLAYEIPIYLHIDMRTDNLQALQFWWYASTCRHLGIGGTHPDPNSRAVHKEAMARYRRLKQFYTHGKFYGIAENIHLHVLPDRKAATLNLFNLEDGEQRVTADLDLREFGLDGTLFRAGHGYRQTLAQRDKVSVNQRMAPRSAAVIELAPA